MAKPKTSAPAGNSPAEALAADIARPVYKAPPPPIVAPAYNWTGFYVGGHFGGGWARKAWEEKSESNGGFGGVCFGSPPDFNPLCPFELLSGAPGSAFGQFPASVGSHNAIGPLGGFQAGFNWQPVGSHWVFGIEGQFSFAGLKGDHQNSISGADIFFGGITPALIKQQPFTVVTNGTINDRFSTKVTDIATIAGRIGITSDVFDRTLFYVKGGGAWARDHYGVTSQFSALSCTQEGGLIALVDDGGGGPVCSTVNGNGSWSGNQNRWGWMAGIGLEFGLFGNWSAKIEYDYLGFGSRDVTLNGSATASCFGPCRLPEIEVGADPTTTSVFSRTFRINENIQVIKLGLNYRFNWGKAPAPVVASY
jgi:outer membrane immunogenic protein